MTTWVTRIWIGLAIILPALIGLALIFAPDQVAPEGATINTVAGMVGVRNLVYSGVLIAAALMLGPKAVGVLVAGRGATDLLDGLLSLIEGQPVALAAGPIVMALISFGVAYLLLNQPASRKDPLSVGKGS